MYICMVVIWGRVWINRVRLPIPLVVSWTGNKNKISVSPFAPENLVSRNRFGRPVPRQSLHLHTQAEPGACSRDFSRFPRRRHSPFIYLNHHTPSGQFRVDRATLLHTNDVHCRESAATGSVVLKVVPVTGALPLYVSRWTNSCAPLFSHAYYWYEKWACVIHERSEVWEYICLCTLHTVLMYMLVAGGILT